MKISENLEKITNPGFKSLYRFYDKSTGRCLADLITLDEEPMPCSDEYTIFHEISPWKTKTLRNFVAQNLRVQLFRKGTRVYDSPAIDQIKEHCASQINTLWDEMLRFDNPQTYYVDLSQKLWEMKNKLIIEYR